MKYTSLGVAALLLPAIAVLTGCDERNLPTEAQIFEFQDSVGAFVPGATSIQARAERDNLTDYRNLKVIVGVSGFYNAPEEVRQAIAIQTGQMALRILGRNVDNGTFILTRDIRNHEKDPEDAQKSDMKIDSLKSATPAK